MLGEFEYLILAAAHRLKEGAYGASIAMELEQVAERRCSLGALYTTLDRMESKGLIKTHMSDPTPERGGRAKRIVQVTGAGRKAAAEWHLAITRVSKGIRWEVANG